MGDCRCHGEGRCMEPGPHVLARSRQVGRTQDKSEWSCKAWGHWKPGEDNSNSAEVIPQRFCLPAPWAGTKPVWRVSGPFGSSQNPPGQSTPGLPEHSLPRTPNGDWCFQQEASFPPGAGATSAVLYLMITLLFI